MGRKPMRNPSFFQILIGNDFTHKLILPSAFTGKYGGMLPKNAKLKISSGGTWQVRLEQMEDQHYYFTRGGSKFVKDLELKIFELLVFWFNNGESTFNVSVYGTTACQKVSKYFGYTNFHAGSGLKKKESGLRNEAVSSDDETKPDNCTNPRFEIVLKKHQVSRVCISKNFAQSSGLIGRKMVGLEYPGGYDYDVAVDFRCSNKVSRFELAAGWAKFRKANGLQYGERYSFEFIPSKYVIRVKHIK